MLSTFFSTSTIASESTAQPKSIAVTSKPIQLTSTKTFSEGADSATTQLPTNSYEYEPTKENEIVHELHEQVEEPEMTEEEKELYELVEINRLKIEQRTAPVDKPGETKNETLVELELERLLLDAGKEPTSIN